MILMTFLQQGLIFVQEKEDHLNKQCYTNHLCLKVFHGHKQWAGLFKLNLQQKPTQHLIILTSQKVRLSYSDDNSNFHNRNTWKFFFFVCRVPTWTHPCWQSVCGNIQVFQTKCALWLSDINAEFHIQMIALSGSKEGKPGMRYPVMWL